MSETVPEIMRIAPTRLHDCEAFWCNNPVVFKVEQDFNGHKVTTYRCETHGTGTDKRIQPA